MLIRAFISRNRAMALLLGFTFPILTIAGSQPRNAPPATVRTIRGVIESHLRWLATGGAEGQQADLRGFSGDIGIVDLALIDGLILRDVNLSRADIRDAWLPMVDFTRAILVAADLRESHLRWAILSRADLTESNLAGANLWGAVLTGANLDGAILTGACPYWEPLDRKRGRRNRSFRHPSPRRPIRRLGVFYPLPTEEPGQDN
jgi:uncharacterized protein YjbI with pentapeptide repeats